MGDGSSVARELGAIDNGEVDPREFPEKRSPKNVEATEDTLIQELSTVTDRHDGDLSHDQIAQVLFDYADSYVMVLDVEIELEAVEKPDGGTGALIHFTGPRADVLDPSPIGKFHPEDLEQMGDVDD